MIAVPAAPALVAQQAAPGRPAQEDLPSLTPSVPDAVAEMTPRFFTPAQFSALRKVSEILMPPINGAVGALDAKAPEFLDFLIGESPADRQRVYQAGLDALNEKAKTRFQKPFAELDGAQAAEFMVTLNQPWTYESPSDPIAAFLRAAKQDVRTATMNSREYSGGSTGGGGRRFGGGGLYWYPLD